MLQSEQDTMTEGKKHTVLSHYYSAKPLELFTILE